MPIHIANRRTKVETLQKNFDEPVVIDVTSRGIEPWVRFSPFYPHGEIPVPFSPGIVGASVEGIWQALKVFESEDVDQSKLEVRNMKGLKRTVRRLGRVLGHRAGVHGDRLLPYSEARKQIYLPCYKWVLQNCLQDEVAELRRLATSKTVVLLDYNRNCDVEDLSKPLSHAGLVKMYVGGRLKVTTSTPRVCAISGATGGPPDVKQVLDRFPADFPIPILLCQKLSEGSLERFAAQLEKSSRLTVKLAKADEKVVPATVYVSHGDRHLGVSHDGKIVMSDAPRIGPCRPSATYLFESVAKSYADESVGIIVSGLGQDGIAGLIALHKAGGTVVAVDKSSALYFGTPADAIKAGAVDYVLPVDEIADYLVELVGCA